MGKIGKVEGMMGKLRGGSSMAAHILLLAALPIACGPGNFAAVAPPAMPRVSDAAAVSAQPPPGHGAWPVWVIDWEPEDRHALDTEMRKGVPLLSYDGKTIRVLHCHLEGDYKYAPLSGADTDVKHLTTSDQLEANLPKTGAALGLELGAELKQGASIDITTVTVGMRTAAIKRASRSKLPGDCADATHFVLSADIGAFVMDAGTQTKAHGGLKVLGGGATAGSKSALKHHKEQGKRAACHTDSKDTDPPPQCEAVFRIELVEISADDTPTANAEDSSPSDARACPAGRVFSKGICTTPTDDAAHECAMIDPADCEKQCERKDLMSCEHLGSMYAKAQGVTKDEGRAVQLFTQACDGGVPGACFNLGSMYSKGRGVAPNDANAAQLYKKACDADHAGGCSSLGFMYSKGRGGLPLDLARASQLYTRSCDLGDAQGCSNLGVMLEDGRGMPPDRARAALLYKRACDGGKAIACSNLGELYEKGKGVPADPVLAAKLFKQACDGGIVNSGAIGCNDLGKLYETGKGVETNPARAAELFKQACDAGNVNHGARGCNNLGKLYETGKGVETNPARAAELFKQACADGSDDGSADGCNNLSELYEKGNGVPADPAHATEFFTRAIELYKKGCERGDPEDCEKQKDLGKRAAPQPASDAGATP